MKKITITTSSFGKIDHTPIEMLTDCGLEVILNPYGRKIIKKEIIELCCDSIGVIAGTELIDAEVIDHLPKMEVISRCGVATENVDKNALGKHSILLYNTPYAPVPAVAELTISLILNVLRHVNLMDSELRQGVWKKRMGGLLEGKKIGIIGLGRIGQRVAELLSCFGTKIAYFDVCEVSQDVPYLKMEFNDLLSWSDIVTLHCPQPSDGNPLLGEDELMKMKKGAYLINASRGELVDESKLYQLLSTDHLSGAAVDVFNKEPYTGPLTQLNNIILTPHIGSYASEARVNMETTAVENMLTGLKEKKIL